LDVGFSTPASEETGISLIAQSGVVVPNVMKNSIAILALVLSVVSLGFQAHNTKSSLRFDKFLVPAHVSEFDYRAMQANQRMIRDSLNMEEGMGVPYVKDVTDDHKRVAVWVLVSEKYLPSGYEARRKALLYKAVGAATTVDSEFDIDFSQQSDAVSVEFVSVESLAKNDKKPYAEFVKGELMLH
jgi:hypothetical protein